MYINRLVEQVAMLYPAVYHRIHARWQRDEYRPSSESLAILHYLNWSGPQTVTELATRFHRAQSAMSEAIDRLHRRALISRVSDGRDRRRTLIWVTEDGTALLERTEQVLDPGLLKRCMLEMPEADRAQLINGLKALVAAADEISERDDTGHRSKTDE